MENYEFTKDKQSELGKGSFSTVYLGTYKGYNNTLITYGTKVAIKIIKTQNIPTKAKEILQEELNIMELIKYDPHPNIVRCYDVIMGDTESYIVMEYCDSGDLRGILKKPIKEKYAQFYFCQLANGLKYLDKHSIIHRDIKPKNILLTNSRRVLKIADFGFAKKVINQSLHETFCGSPLYMAPEIMNNNLYNNQIDLWSVGLILYEMLYGFHPFGTCKTIPELRSTVGKNAIEIPPPGTKNDNVSENCIQLLKKLLQKQATQRINWDEFFNNPWIKTFQYNSSNDNKKSEYENKLYSTSIGSLSKDSGFLMVTESFAPIVRCSHLGKIVIVDDFCDSVDNKVENDWIFEMEFDVVDNKCHL
jgi:serine/threonine-protein kinase ULK/ATG1